MSKKRGILGVPLAKKDAPSVGWSAGKSAREAKGGRATEMDTRPLVYALNDKNCVAAKRHMRELLSAYPFVLFSGGESRGFAGGFK